MEESIKVHIKLTRKKLILVSLLVLFFLGIFLYEKFVTCYGPFAVTCVDYRGITFNFRTNLKDAQKIPIFPNESSVNSEFSNDKIKNITIAYKQSKSEIPIVTVEAVEISNKLKLFYLSDSNKTADVLFNVLELDSFENISGSFENPIIVIKSPSQSSKNQVSLSNHVAVIEGRSLAELDLATVKFIMAVLGLKV